MICTIVAFTAMSKVVTIIIAPVVIIILFFVIIILECLLYATRCFTHIVPRLYSNIICRKQRQREGK